MASMHCPLRGDECELYREHNQRLVATIRGRLKVSDDDARDVAQFAWLMFLEKQPSRQNAFGWLYTTAKFEVYARYRRGKRDGVTTDGEPPEAADEPDLAEQLDRAEVARLVAGAVRAVLTDNQRRARALGYRYKEIAERLGKTYTWANRHISEGLRALRGAMGREPRPHAGGRTEWARPLPRA
jgi:DNA-directed RNA polymerase specialized sigma24 family protein